MASAAVFGTGIAGLTAAHELILAGFKVDVYEASDSPGGCAKSARREEDDGVCSEFSYRGFGPWYRNVFDIMRDIPHPNDKKLSLYDTELSRDISFYMPSDDEQAATELREQFQLTWMDKLVICLTLARTWVAGKRSELYAKTNAANYLQRYLSARASKTINAIYGPWVGIDPERQSLHDLAIFFRKNTFPGSSHFHNPDEEGPGWLHGAVANDGWLVLKKPSNESWFGPWVTWLRKKGVTFHFNCAVTELKECKEIPSLLSGVLVHDKNYQCVRLVQAEHYVLAISPFSTAQIVANSRLTANHPELNKFSKLVADGEHIQVSFRLGFGEKIKWNKKRCMIILPDSEFNLTFFPQDNLWAPEVDLGKNGEIKSLWSGTACVAYVPGKLFGLPMRRLDKESFLEEVIHQITRSKSLQSMVTSANNGRALSSFKIIHKEVWHGWEFGKEKGDLLHCSMPKWVSSTSTRPHLPNARTSLSNLVLAGAHCKTMATIWSMEGACESGRRAAQLIINRGDLVIPEYEPALLKYFRPADDMLYTCGLFSIVDMILLLIFIAIAAMFLQLF